MADGQRICGAVRMFGDNAVRSCQLTEGHLGDHAAVGAFGEIRGWPRWGA